MSDSDPKELAQCPECRRDGLRTCVHALTPDSDSGKGRGSHRAVEDMDVMDRSRMPMGYRLARGFAILRGGSV